MSYDPTLALSGINRGGKFTAESLYPGKLVGT